MKTDHLLQRLYAWTVAALSAAEVLLVVVSWLLSATLGEHVRSLLSGEGVRWLLGSIATTLATPQLVWLLMLGMAIGVALQSGLTAVPSQPSPTFRQMTARRVVVALLIIYIFVVLLLTAVPHAVLLSATGRLWPSPFSHALIPLLALGLLLLSAVYGWLSGRFASVADIVSSLSYGIARTAPLLVLYVLAVQLWASVCFVSSYGL